MKCITFLLAYVLITFNHVSTFLEVFGTSYFLWCVVDWYDAFIIDCLWFCHDKRFIISGTEDMKEYHDYMFHLKGSLKGMLIGLLVAVLGGIFTGFIA